MQPAPHLSHPLIFHPPVTFAMLPQALASPSKGFVPFDRLWLEKSIPARFAHQVAQRPEQIAIKTATQAITYAELNRSADRLAQALQKHCSPGPEPIALLLHDDVAAVIGILGILKTGKFFVNLNPAMPLVALQKTLTSTGCQRLITTRDHSQLVAALETCDALEILWIEEVEQANDSAIDSVPVILPNAYAQIVSTSGSTGAPKNVLVTHETLLHQSMVHINGYYISPTDRLMVTTPLTFGSSLSDLFAALLGGATLCPIQVQAQSLATLIDWLKAEEITIYHSVSTLYRQMVQLLSDDDHFPYLRVVKLGGETVHRVDLDAFKQHFADHCLFRVGLAGTEANLIAWYFAGKETELNTATVPVGYALVDKEILLLDDAGNLVAPGATGEIVVRSRFLSPGYWGDPELTAAKFRPDPEGGNRRLYHTGDLGRLTTDGILEHLGRKDQMVKIRGYRVELAAIEGALLELPGVREAAVLAGDGVEQNQRLVAYVVPRGEPIAGDRLRNALQSLLPDYMIPTHFVMLDELPLLSNGKVNRKALPTPDQSRPELATPYAPARTPLEAQLVVLWETLLTIQPIGIHDDFFALGGHSLTLLLLANQLKAQFGQEVPVTSFLQGSTIAQLALFLQTVDPTDAGTTPANQAHLAPQLTPADARLIERYRVGRTTTLPSLTRQQWLLDRLFPYGTRMRLFRLAAGNRFVRSRLFADECKTVDQFVRALGAAPEQADHLLRDHLVRIWCRRYCRGVLARRLPSVLTNYVSITGQTHLERALQRQQRVILVDLHVLFVPGLLPLILQQLGYGDLMTYAGQWVLQQDVALLQAFQRYFDSAEEALVIAKFLSLQMDVAQRTLNQGGIVWIAPDGGSGKRSLTFSIVGYQRSFSTGFAELALQTGAVVIPVRRTIRATGEIQVTFLAPLDPGPPTAEHEVRIQHLMQQYVDFLEETWQLDPGNVNLGHMQSFLQGRSEENVA